MNIIRNVFRRRLRAFLTIFGITIGVFALVVMGSVAEKMNLLVDGGTRYFSDKVTVSDASGSMWGAAPMSIDKIRELQAVDGVAAAKATVGMMLKEDQGMSMGMPQSINGGDLSARQYESFKLHMAKGRDLQEGDRAKVAVGSDVAKSLGAVVGQKVTIRGKSFEVIGIYEKTLTAPDSAVAMSLPDAQQLLFAQLPKVIQQQMRPEQLATGITVYPKAGVEPNELASVIEKQVPGVKAYGPKVFKEQVSNATKIFNALIFGVALISLLVGGLSVVNTMTMSVLERTREIGIRKSIGASNRQIVTHFLNESAIIGFLGGATGLLLGWIVTVVVNAFMGKSGTVIFLLTGRLAIGALAFAIVLGVGSGFYPSLRAARLKPVVALRYQ
jgi:putative ABC transport system permease protein